MIKSIRKQSLRVSALVIVGVMGGAEDALASSGKNFSSIAENITTSISSLPGLLTGVAYMLGILLGVLGILKIKDHVENRAFSAHRLYNVCGCVIDDALFG